MKKSSSDQHNAGKTKRNESGPEGEFNLPDLGLSGSDSKGGSKEKYKIVREMWEDLVKGYSFLDKNYEAEGTINASGRQSVSEYNSLTRQESSGWNKMQEDAFSMNENLFNSKKLVPFDTYKRAEDQHKKFIKAVEMTPSIVIVMNRDCIIEYVNPNFKEVTGYKSSEIVGKDFSVMISDLASHDEYEQISRAIQGGVSWKGELVNRKKNGEWYILKAEIAPVNDEEGGIIDYLVVGQDVTPVRETEIRLEEAIDDKSILLSELHHRVKNNLAILSGMMQLQAFDEPDTVLQNKLFSSVGRVRTMANMHELLYESGSLSRLEFGRNIERIVESVSETFADTEADIKVKYSMEPVLLNINQAHPCSLIMNEVITNVYKHAFEGLQSGTIEVLMMSRANKVTMKVSDNGKGLPDGFKIRAGRFTLGHQLLRTLVKQINGKFEYTTSDSGSTFTLEFIRENHKGPANARMV